MHGVARDGAHGFHKRLESRLPLLSAVLSVQAQPQDEVGRRARVTLSRREERRVGRRLADAGPRWEGVDEDHLSGARPGSASGARDVMRHEGSVRSADKVERSLAERGDQCSCVLRDHRGRCDGEGVGVAAHEVWMPDGKDGAIAKVHLPQALVAQLVAQEAVHDDQADASGFVTLGRTEPDQRRMLVRGLKHATKVAAQRRQVECGCRCGSAADRCSRVALLCHAVHVKEGSEASGRWVIKHERAW